MNEIIGRSFLIHQPPGGPGPACFAGWREAPGSLALQPRPATGFLAGGCKPDRDSVLVPPAASLNPHRAARAGLLHSNRLGGPGQTYRFTGSGQPESQMIPRRPRPQETHQRPAIEPGSRPFSGFLQLNSPHRPRKIPAIGLHQLASLFSRSCHLQTNPDRRHRFGKDAGATTECIGINCPWCGPPFFRFATRRWKPPAGNDPYGAGRGRPDRYWLNPCIRKSGSGSWIC